MQIRLPARIGAFACLGVALAMGVLALREEPEPVAQFAPARVEAVADPLRARLAACQQAGEAAATDASCLAAWAENRRRFLGSGSREPIDTARTAPAKSSEPSPLPGGAISREQ